jgi:hypothetical protein
MDETAIKAIGLAFRQELIENPLATVNNSMSLII